MSLDAGLIDQVTNEFLNAFRNEAAHIKTAATSLFYYLTVIQLVVSTLWMTVSGESLQKMFTRWLGMAITFSIFYACILNGGHWIPALLNGFIQIGQGGAIQSIDPGSVLDQGFSIAGGIMKGLATWRVLSFLVVVLFACVASISVLIIYAFIAAELAIMLVKT